MIAEVDDSHIKILRPKMSKNEIEAKVRTEGLKSLIPVEVYDSRMENIPYCAAALKYDGYSAALRFALVAGGVDCRDYSVLKMLENFYKQGF